MNEFQVGEIANLQNFVGALAPLNGVEVEIIGDLALTFFTDFDGFGKLDWVYMVNHCGVKGVVRPSNLRKKKPPTTGEEMIRQMFLNAPQPVMEPA